jgi:hypothetical protein
MGDTLSEKAYIQSRKEAINVTYDELVNLTNTSALKPQSCYRITDYRTVHNIMDTNNMAVGINVGESEPIIVTAISKNKLSTLAISEQYPQDIIHYDWDFNNWLYDYSFGNCYFDEGGNPHPSSNPVSDFKGVIFFRHDTLLDNYVGYDFRNVKFRRWVYSEDGYTKLIQQYDPTKIYSVGDRAVVPESYAVYESVVNNNVGLDVIDPNYWTLVLDLTQAKYWSNTDNGNFYIDFKTFPEINQTYENGIISTHFETFKGNINNNFVSTLLGNNVFLLTDNAHYNVDSNLIGPMFSYNTCNGGFIRNHIESNFSNNIIESHFMNNHIGSGFSQNKIGSGFQGNVIGASFEQNTIGNYVGFNVIGSNFVMNTLIDSFTNNTVAPGLVFSGDLTNATPLYESYNCTLLSGEDMAKHVMYVDINGQLKIQSI